MAMSRDEAQRVLDDIDQEGFDYTFENYSDYRDIRDPEFHYRRQEYVKAAKYLRLYLARSAGMR